MWGDASTVDNVCLNDWGSARPPTSVRDTVGTNPVYRCPQLGTHFECVEPGLLATEFQYGAVNDLRALFLSFLAFGLQPRRHGSEELPGMLPWERHITNMQAVKLARMSQRSDDAFWNPAVYRPEAARLLSRLRQQLFLTEPPPPLEHLYAAFAQLGCSTENDAGISAVSLAAIPEHDAATKLSAKSAPAASVSASSILAPTLPATHFCRCRAGAQLCGGTSNCGCVRRGHGCSAACGCSDSDGAKGCVNPHQQ